MSRRASLGFLATQKKVWGCITMGIVWNFLWYLPLSKLSQLKSKAILKIMQLTSLDKTKADIQIEKDKVTQKHVAVHHKEIDKMNASIS